MVVVENKMGRCKLKALYNMKQFKDLTYDTNIIVNTIALCTAKFIKQYILGASITHKKKSDCRR